MRVDVNLQYLKKMDGICIFENVIRRSVWIVGVFFFSWKNIMNKNVPYVSNFAYFETFAVTNSLQ